MVISIKKYLEMDFSKGPSGDAGVNETQAALVEFLHLVRIEPVLA